MRTAQEQQLIIKIAHNFNEVTPEEIQAITPEILNSKINDGSLLSERYVAFVLAMSTRGRQLLRENNDALASQINAETLNAVIQRGPYAGESVAFALTKTTEGYAILALNNNALGSRINTETLNAIIQQGPWAGESVAFALARRPNGRTILAANENTLALQIKPKTLNAIIQRGEYAGKTVAHALATSSEGRAILAANNNALGLKISENTLRLRIIPATLGRIRQGASAQVPLAFQSTLALQLASTDEGRAILAAIDKRLENDNIMLALYSTEIQRLGEKSKISMLPNDLIGSVLTMLDGRTPKKLKLK